VAFLSLVHRVRLRPQVLSHGEHVGCTSSQSPSAEHAFRLHLALYGSTSNAYLTVAFLYSEEYRQNMECYMLPVDPWRVLCDVVRHSCRFAGSAPPFGTDTSEFTHSHCLSFWTRCFHRHRRNRRLDQLHHMCFIVDGTRSWETTARPSEMSSTKPCTPTVGAPWPQSNTRLTRRSQLASSPRAPTSASTSLEAWRSVAVGSSLLVPHHRNDASSA
jgi:hypothetical protein